MERASKRICTARLRIDCDEWRLLCIPDRDGAAIGAAPPRSVLLNCFFPGAVFLDYWKPGAGFNGRADGFTRVDSAWPVADQ